MSGKRPDASERHPIQVVSRRTGLTPDVLRAWERRYEAIMPSRTQGSRRLYSDDDVERLVLLRRATSSGRSIGQIAHLPTDRLRALVLEDEEAAGIAGRATAAAAEPSAPPVEAGGHLAACLLAVRDLDGAALETAVGRALIAFGPLVASDRILVPLLTEIGHSWERGALGIVHEHMASAAIRTMLGTIAQTRSHRPGAPGLVVATPAGALHELGALMAAVSALACGWSPTFLGPDLPAEEIAAAARARGARAVALGITHPADDPDIAAEIERLRAEMPEIPIIVGGEASSSYAATLASVRALRHDTMAELRETLSRLAEAT